MISRKLEKLASLFEREMKRYKRIGLKVCRVCVDNEFNTNMVVDAVRPAILHVCTAKEHVGKGKRRNRTVK